MSELEKAAPKRFGIGRIAAVRDFAARLPGADIAREVYQGVEHVALNELKQRLALLDEEKPQAPESSALGLSHRIHPRQLLAALLDEATEQDLEAAKRSLFTALLLQLTADEACMLAALSDESIYAIVHVAVGSGLTGQRVVARNFCSLERGAPVKLREYVPAYVSHLEALGLVEVGPEAEDLNMKYQILEGLPTIHALVKQLGTQHRSVKLQRRSLKISKLGLDLWQFCDPSKIRGG